MTHWNKYRLDPMNILRLMFYNMHCYLYNSFCLCYKVSFFVFNFSAGIFSDILIQQHSTSTLYFKCAPICLISLRWFCYTDRLTLMLLLYEDSSLFYMQGSVTQNILLSSGRLYYSSMCLFSFFISCSKNHSKAVFKNTVASRHQILPF